MLRTLDDRAPIETAQAQLVAALERRSARTDELSLGFQGGAAKAPVRWLRDVNLWHAYARFEGSHWNPIGIGDPFAVAPTILVELNVPISGVRRRVGGVFVTDEQGRVFIAHRGRVGGGRKGIGKTAFLAHYQGQTEIVQDGGVTSRLIVIADLTDAKLPEALARFASAVSAFKKDATTPDPNQERWDRFAKWARRAAEWRSPVGEERTYKLVLAERMAVARQAIETLADGWPVKLMSAFASPNNLTSHFAHARFLEWARERPPEASHAMKTLWAAVGTAGTRIDAFLSQVPAEVLKGPGTRLNIASYLLAACGVEEHPCYKHTVIRQGWKTTGFGEPEPNSSEGATYEHTLDFFDTIAEELEARRLPVKDRLDAQGLLWLVLKGEQFKDSLSPELQVELDMYRSDGGPTPTGYTFFVYPDLDARVGLAARGSLLAVHVASSGGTESGVVRNTERPELFGRLIEALGRELRGQTVLAAKGGRSDAPEAPIRKAIGSGADADVTGRFRSGGGFRFDFWIELDEPPELDELARRLGLVRIEHPSHVSVLWPAIEPPPPPPRALTFAGVVAALRNDGLVFSEETVANFLLALQTRRFVILSGISGTGKTRLALAVAKCFPMDGPAGEAEVIDTGDAVRITVRPDMLKRHRFILPAQFAARVPGLAGATGTVQVNIQYPEGEQTVSVYIPERYTLVLLRGAIRNWFESNLTEGQSFLVDVLDDEKQPPTLRLRLDARTTQRRPVENCLVMAVRPDWTDNRGLLGYLNPLTGRYVRTPFLDLLLRAGAEESAATAEQRAPHPFLAILDEMNLARVEHYFSDFLSAMESGQPLHLHDELSIEEGDVEDGKPVPRRLGVPRNLFFVGTVNVDETTYMFSPKVLDRAFTIELHDVDLEGLGGSAGQDSELRLDRWNGQLVVASAPSATDWVGLSAAPQSAAHRAQIVALHRVLAKHGRHFGYRVANEIARYLLLASWQSAPEAAGDVALDLSLLQKVLPKLHGTQQELAPILDELLMLVLPEPTAAEIDKWVFDPTAGWRRASEPRLVRLPRTARKLWRMRRQLHAQGFTSFVE